MADTGSLCESLSCEPGGDLTCGGDETCCVDRCCGAGETCCTGIPVPPGEGLCTSGIGGCPISRRSAKKNIRHISPAEAKRFAKQIQKIRLATYHYRGEPDGQPTHLGFIIDEQPGPHTVAADGNHVDLYGYTSLAVATLQVQAKQIEVLSAQLNALQREVETLRERKGAQPAEGK